MGGLVGALLAADCPERIGALIMYASVARTSWAPDYDWAMTSEEREALSERNIADWGEAEQRRDVGVGAVDGRRPGAGRVVRAHAAPGRQPRRGADHLQGDGRPRRARRAAAHPRAHARHAPPAASWSGTCATRATWPSTSRARATSSSRGSTRFPFVGDSDAIVEEIEEFLTGGRSGGELARALLTVMFTDIVDATARAAELGDGRWRDLLARHDEQVRKELARFGGREVKTVGDGFLATFDGPPSRALRCALAITGAARELGVEVRIGMHTGECELIGEDVGGMAVHIASRVSGLAGPGEVLVSGTVFGTVVGGPFAFEDRGFHELKGVPGRWPLFALGG